MSIRTFIFCDHCNKDAIRTIERRATNREIDPLKKSRRHTDDRSWFEASDIAEAPGWIEASEHGHLCPRCSLLLEQEHKL